MGGETNALHTSGPKAAQTCLRALPVMTAMTPEDAIAHVTQNEPAFALTTAEIRGTEFKVFQNIPQTVGSLLRASWEAQGDGALEYLVYGDESWTFESFCDDIKAVAAALQSEFGIKPGDRVAIAMRNYPELLILMMAITQAGGVITFLNAWWTTEELDYALGDSTPDVVFADGPRAERLTPLTEKLDLTIVGVRDAEATAALRYSELKAKGAGADWLDLGTQADDDFAIMYSSGTTGHPKGVVQTHRGAVNAVFSWLMQAVMAPLIDPPEDGAPEPPRPAVLIATPLFHVTATHPCFLLSLPAGAKIVLIPKWDPEEAARLIETHQITRLLGVPTQSADLMMAAQKLGMTLSSLDYIGAGGAKRPPAQVEKLAETFPNANIATGWGMTETNALGIGLIGDDYVTRPGAAGKLHPPLQELRLLDEDGNEVPQGTPGEITVKSPANMRCYLNKPEATDEVLQDGWLKTGDMGVLDAEGFITIVDRKKNIIIRGGENIACLDVEAAIHAHADVIEACAFSVPDERLGEIVGSKVHVTPGSTLDADTLRSFLKEHIAHFKIPDHIWITTAPLPRAATDKLDRRGVRATCLGTL